MTEISCVIPVFNGEAYIGQAIESVLNQTMRIDQLIVVDDGSEDGTLKVIETFGDRLTCIRKAHTGVSDTINHGLQIATGNYIVFLDADDLWNTDKTQIEHAYLEEHKEYAMAFCLIQEFVSPELPDDVRHTLSFRAEPMNGIGKTSAMIRRQCFETIGLFSEVDLMGEFLDWYGRATDAGLKSHMISEILTYRRVHPQNFTRTNRWRLQNYTQILKRSIDRKRMNS